MCSGAGAGCLLVLRSAMLCVFIVTRLFVVGDGIIGIIVRDGVLKRKY